MSVLFATVAVVCTMSVCNDYVIDTAQDEISQMVNTSQQRADYESVWQDEKGLTEWLKEYQIDETIFEIVSIDIEHQNIEQEDIP